MTEDEALQLYFESHYPVKHGFSDDMKYEIMEAEKTSIGFAMFKASIEMNELKDSIRDVLPKWLKWVI